MSKVLVCVVGQIRASSLTWPSFCANVLEPLGADLAVCTDLGAAHDPAEPFLAHARHTFDASRPEPLDVLFDRVQAELIPDAAARPDWRQARRVPGNWLGGLGDIAGSGAIMMHQRWCLLRSLREAGLLNRYERFIVTRSDFFWAAPHPPMALLSPHHVWVPQGQDHDGLNDRHAVVSAPDVPAFLDVMSPLLRHPDRACRDFADAPEINFEQYLRWCVSAAGLTPRVRRMPYTMFLVREPDGPTNWTTGSWDEDLKCCIKLRPECDAAFATHALFPTSGSWLESSRDKPLGDDIVPVAELCGLVRPWSLARWPFQRKTMPSQAELVRTGIRVRIKTGLLEVVEGGPRGEPLAQKFAGQRLGYGRPQGHDSRHVRYRDAFYITTGTGMLMWRRDGRVRVRELRPLDRISILGRLWNLLIRLAGGSLFTFVANDSTSRAS